MARWLFFISFLTSLVSYSQDDLSFSVEKLKEYKFKNWDSVEYYGNRILELSNQSQHLERGLAYQYLGVAQYEKIGNYDSALSLYDLSLVEFEENNDSIQLATLYNNYGVVYKIKASYEKALDAFFKGTYYVSTITTSNAKLKSTLLNNIGEVSLFMGNTEEAEKYHQLAYDNALKIGDSLQIGVSLVYLGNLASSKMGFQQAIDYYTKSLEYLRNYNYNTANIIMNIGVVYHYKGDLKKAIAYYKKGVDIGTKNNSTQSVALCYLNMGEAMLDLNDKDAPYNLHKAIEIASDYQLKRVLSTAHQFLASYYEKNNEPRLALDHFKLQKIYNDSILNESSTNRLNELNVKFNTAQKEKQIVDQELEIEQKNASITKQRNQKFQIAAALLFLLLVGGLFYLRARMQQKSNLQQAIIQEKEKGLKAVFVATETERQRISKDLHDGVGQQLSGVKMQLESLALKEEALVEQKNRITENLAKASQEIRQISHQMMPRSLEEEGLIPTLEDLFEKTFSGTSINCAFEHHDVAQRFPKDIELSIYRITQELLNNIIKHANAKKVEVQLYKIKNKLVMTVEDDGIGFNVETKREGHGLLNIKSRIETVNGKVEYESKEKSETVITLSIPIT